MIKRPKDTKLQAKLVHIPHLGSVTPYYDLCSFWNKAQQFKVYYLKF